MSLSVTMNSAVSGLQAAQLALQAVSDNIANVNTPGYVRTTVNQTPLVTAGAGQGVHVQGIQRVTDQFLEAASQTAGSDSSRWSAYSQYIDTAQGLFGDPSGTNYFFNRLDTVYSGFAAAANDPSSTLLRTQATDNVQNFLGDAQQINDQLNQMSGTMDSRVSADVATANGLLQQIDALNSSISRAALTNQDATGAENQQAQLVNQLTALIGVNVTQRAQGGVDIRSPEGVQLAGDGAATLVYNSSSTTPGYISVAPTNGQGAATPIQVNTGEVRGLLDMRNTTLPQMTDQLGEFVQRAVDQLNDAHNASTAVPAPATLTGRNTGLDLATAASNFTGQTTIALVDSTGTIQTSVNLDFDTDTISVNGTVTGSFSPATLDTDITSAFGGAVTASFSNGALSLSATTPGQGISIDEGASNKAGQGFSAYFGLNDLVTSSGPGTYDTGMTLSDPNNFAAGGTITLRMSQPGGKPIRDVTVTVPTGGTIGDLVTALNSNSAGVGLYGQFSLDSNGQLSFTGSPPANAQMSVVQDSTQYGGAGGMSMSQLFGLSSGERSTRTDQFEVNPTIAADPTQLAFSELDLSATGPAISAGDATGALALANAGNVSTRFAAAGSLGATTTTVSDYASEFSGAIGRAAANASNQQDAAAAVQSEANTRLQSTEGVNLDEELVNMTTYQQAYSASARVIQATQDLFTALSNLIT